MKNEEKEKKFYIYLERATQNEMIIRYYIDSLATKRALARVQMSRSRRVCSREIKIKTI